MFPGQSQTLQTQRIFFSVNQGIAGIIENIGVVIGKSTFTDEMDGLFKCLLGFPWIAYDKTAPAHDPLVIEHFDGIQRLLAFQALVHLVKDGLTSRFQTQIDEFTPGLLHELHQIRSQGAGPCKR